MAALSLIVKITNGTEIRRFSSNKGNLTFSKLVDTSCELFGLKVDKKNVKFTYVDDEGDRITLSSGAELEEAKELALKTSPAVLRLTIATNDRTTNSTTDVPMADAATNPDATPTTDASTDTGAPQACGAPSAELQQLLDNIAKSLPGLVGQLPPTVRNLIPHAELDVAATLAANAAANAPAAAAAAAAAATAAAQAAANGTAAAAQAMANNPQGIHPGVTCDRSGQNPIIGMRYHLVGHNYDLCEAEYEKLDDKERALYQRIPPPFVHPIGGGATGGAPEGIHPGVECDKTGMCPIVGMRYHMRGHNYDLCEAEYNKLPAQEKLLYEMIPPPATRAAAGPGAGGPPWRPCGRWGGGWGGGGCHGAGWGGFHPHKLAARFVRDVTIFDGTQMAPATPFTKIWRLKNTGEVPWPPGTKMLFVGGDQMTTEMSVPLSRTSPVMPGEEVDVAVEMVAPVELGRYLGYWRLVGPHGKRKFGQRVWCHVQVVDPSTGHAEEPMDEAALAAARAEIERKHSDLAAADADADADTPPSKALTSPAAGASSAAAGAIAAPTTAPADVADVTDAPAPVPAVPIEDDAAERASDDGVLVTAADVLPDSEAPPAPTAEAGSAGAGGATASETPLASLTASLAAMGFTDAGLVQVVLDKHGADLAACARDLAAATEWEAQLDDLEEMGFANRELNKALMLKHNGNVKRTVRELVEEDAE